jgi:hypothetical protein
MGQLEKKETQEIGKTTSKVYTKVTSAVCARQYHDGCYLYFGSITTVILVVVRDERSLPLPEKFRGSE